MASPHALHRRLFVEALEDRALLAAIYMDIPGIKGEVTDKGHKFEIELESWSWGTSPSGGGGGSGKPSVQDLTVTKVQDSTSVKFMEALSKGKTFSKVEIHFVKSRPNEPVEYIDYKLTKAQITSYTTSFDPVPMEHLSFNFEKIKWEYKEQDAKKVKGSSPDADTLGPDLNGDGQQDPLYFNYAQISDLDGNGVLDLIVAANPNNPNTVIADLSGDGQPDFTPPPAPGQQAVEVNIYRPGQPPMLRVALADFDGDGMVDSIFPLDLDGDELADRLVSLPS